MASAPRHLLPPWVREAEWQFVEDTARDVHGTAAGLAFDSRYGITTFQVYERQGPSVRKAQEGLLWRFTFP
jgi:hypothetical protein